MLGPAGPSPNLGLPVKPYREQEVEVVSLYGRRVEQVSPFLDLAEFQTLDLDRFRVSLLHCLYCIAACSLEGMFISPCCYSIRVSARLCA